MTAEYQAIVNDLGQRFDTAFAVWLDSNRADIDKLQMTPGSVSGITAGLKQSLITILSQQAGSAIPPVVVAPTVVVAPVTVVAPPA